MITKTYEDRDSWLADRRGKISGSKLKDIVSLRPYTKDDIMALLFAKGVEFPVKAKKEDLESLLTPTDIGLLQSKAEKKLAFYALISDRLGIPADGEHDMERGQRLEEEALQAFELETKKQVDGSLVMWTRDDNESIALSPDGVISDTEAVEVKALSSARHIQALIEQKIPDEYRFQVLQYFIVCDTLETLYFCFYDPRILAKPFFFFEVKREEVQTEVEKYLEYERVVLGEVDKWTLKLSNF